VIADEDLELVLRKPHLANAKAALEAAVAALEKARLDVQRCTIRAPFNSTILEKHVDLGARVSPTSPLLRVVGTDEYWIEAAVSVEELGWLDIPKAGEQGGSIVHIYNPTVWGPDVRRQGRVLRLLGEVERAGRLAQVLVRVRDPLSIDDEAEPVLLNGSYVRMEIQGKILENVIEIERSHLRDGDRVWVMNDADELDIRQVKVVFRGKDAVYISEGIVDGERMVTADMSAAVNGMPLRLPDDPPAKAGSSGGGAKRP